MKRKFIFLYGFFAFFLFSCGIQKKIVKASGDVVEQSVQQFWNNYQKQLPDFKAIQIKSKLNANINKKNINVTLKLYIEKDKKIWLNASMLGITGARALISPAGVKAYEILDRTYIDEELSYLNEQFNVDFFDYEKVQQLLLGQAPLLASLHNYEFTANEASGEYELSYKKNKALKNSNKKGEYIHSFFFDTNYRLRVIKIQDTQNQTEIIANYSEWQNLQGMNLPSVVKILINSQKPGAIELDYNNFTFEEMQAPFKIPSGYSKREVK